MGDVARGEAVEAAKITLEGETVVYTATLTGVTLTAEQTITATLTPTDGTEPVTATGTVAKEPEIEATTVAMIGNVQYDSLDEAIVEATDGATIKVLKDCETAGMNLSKNLTIKGDGTQTVSFNDKGIALWGKALTFENCKVKMRRYFYSIYSRMGLDGDLCKCKRIFNIK